MAKLTKLQRQEKTNRLKILIEDSEEVIKLKKKQNADIYDKIQELENILSKLKRNFDITQIELNSWEVRLSNLSEEFNDLINNNYL